MDEQKIAKALQIFSNMLRSELHSELDGLFSWAMLFFNHDFKRPELKFETLAGPNRVWWNGKVWVIILPKGPDGQIEAKPGQLAETLERVKLQARKPGMW